jgi:hypothetical protein
VLPGARGVVELGDVVQIGTELSSFPIFRHNGRDAEMVTAELAGDFEAPLYGMLAVAERIEAMDWPEGTKPEIRFNGQPEDESAVTLLWDGEWEVTFVTFRDMGAAFGVALLGIYILVVAQFGSFKLPLVILTPIPLTFLGIIFGHWLFAAPFSATSMIGFIALAGIIVRNSILLVDFIRNEGAGEVTIKVLMDAGAIRFKPILLTAIAAMIGAVVILADPIFQGLAISLLFGLLTSTAADGAGDPCNLSRVQDVTKKPRKVSTLRGFFMFCVNPRSGVFRLILCRFRQPFGGVIHVLPFGEPRAAAGVVNGLRIAVFRLVIPPFQPVPAGRQRADFVILRPLHPVQIRAGLAVHHFGRQLLRAGVAAIHQHKRRPVLARIGGLRHAVHFGRFLGFVVVLHAQDRQFGVHVLLQLGHVTEEQEIAVHENRPAVIAGHMRDQKAGIGEFGRGQRVDVAGIEALCDQIIQLDRIHFDRNGGVLQKRLAGDLISDILARVPTDIDAKGGHGDGPFT